MIASHPVTSLMLRQLLPVLIDTLRLLLGKGTEVQGKAAGSVKSKTCSSCMQRRSRNSDDQPKLPKFIIDPEADW